MKRRILCFVLTMAMVLSMLVVIPATTVTADSYDLSISTVAKFKEFRDAVNAGTYDSGVTVQLTADIDISDADWTPIGNSTSHPFKGTFNGNGHTISGLYQTRSSAMSSGNAGLFGYVSSVDGGSTTITNFKLTSSGNGIKGSNGGNDVGTVVSQIRPSTTGNVTVNVTGVWSTVNFDCSGAAMQCVGGIVGNVGWVSTTNLTTVNIDSCWFSGYLDSPSAGSNHYSGILGWSRENISPRTFNVTNCLFSGTLSLYGADPDDGGGLVGYMKGNTSGGGRVELHMNSCITTGLIDHQKKTSGTKRYGYVIPEVSGSDAEYTINNVYYVENWEGFQPNGWYGYTHTIPSTLTYSNVTSKTLSEVKAMTSSNVTMADTSKWYFGESTELPVPAMIYDNIIAPTPASIFDDMTQSEFVITTDAEMTEFADKVTAGTDFAGKTIKLGADVALNTTVGNTNSAKFFSGNFDGQGHTVTITQSLSSPDGLGGLFSMVRVPANSTVTIKDVHITGTISVSGGAGFMGGLISTVDAGTSGNGGTLNVTNVWNTVRINLSSNSSHPSYNGGFIGFIRHADGLKPLTVTFESCYWDGTINAGGPLYHDGGFIGYTGNNKAGRTLTINISNSVANGTFQSNVDGWNQQFGVLTGFLKGSFSADASAKVTVNIQNVVSIAKATFSKATGSGSKIGLIEEVDGTTELNLTNVYYKPFARTGMTGDFPVVASGSADSTTNVVEKTQAQLQDLTTSSFTDSSKWVKQENNEDYKYYPCPAGIVSTFGSVPASLGVEQTDIYVGTADALNALATAVNNGTTYEGKTIHITADITIESGWTSIGITDSRPFMGNFNGHGHTIEIHQTLSNPDGVGGLIAFSRTPAGGEVTIENLHLTGRIDATNTNTGSGYFGGVAGCVDGNTSGTGGTINFNNVWNSLYINCGNNNMWSGVGGFIGFVRHADGLKPLEINFDSCVWDGTLNVGPAAYYFGGYVGYTGNNKAGRTLTINITNSVAAGKIALNITYDQYAGVLVGYAKGNYNDDATAKVTVNVNNVVSNGSMTFKSGVNCPGSGSKIGHIATINGTTELNMTNLYYKAFTRGALEGKAPALAEGTANTETTVEAKTDAGFSSLNTAAFADSSKWNKSAGYIVCPAGIVSTFGEVPSSLESNASSVISIGSAAALLEIRNAVNNGNSYAGETIKLTADINLDIDGVNGENEWVEIGRGASNAFSGTFDGDGHTINFVSSQHWTTGYIDTQGGLFGHLNGATVKNLVLTGSMDLHNQSTHSGTSDYFGSVAGAVQGETLIQNVKSSVNITTHCSKNSNNGYPGGTSNVAGLVGFIPHNATANIMIKDCEYSGTINAGNQAINYAGIMANTGNGGTKAITITGTKFTGRMTLNENSAYAFEGVAGIFSRVGSGTVTITNSHFAGKIYFNTTKAWPTTRNDNPVMVGQIVGYVNQSNNADTGTVVIDSTVTYVPAKLYTATGTDEANKYVLPEIGRINGVYGGNGANNSDAVVEGMDIYAEARDESTYKGIRFVATISSGNCSGAGTSAATFGIYIMTKDMYDLFRNALTTEKLEAAKAVTAKVTQVKATKYKTSDGGYVVSAVVYGFDTASDKSGELVAIPYAGSKLGDALVTTYNAVFN